MVRTPPFQGGNAGSNPTGDANIKRIMSMYQDKNGKKYTKQEAIGVIPKKTFYCYTRDENNKCNLCPLWDSDKTKEYQEDGYCHYLKRGDWQENGTLHLWDQVKECGINDDIDEEDYS